MSSGPSKCAIIWCGAVVDPPRPGWQRRRWEPQAPKLPDFLVLVRDVEIAHRGALAAGVPAGRVVLAAPADSDLEPHGFEGRRIRATPAALAALIEELRGEAVEHAVIFVATNHGSKEGLVSESTPGTLDEFSEVEPPVPLSPDALGQLMDGLHGPQVLVVSTCHAGYFRGLGETTRERLVVTACAPEEVLLIRGERPVSPLIDAFFGGWLGVSTDGGDHERCTSADAAGEYAVRAIRASTGASAVSETFPEPSPPNATSVGTVRWPTD